MTGDNLNTLWGQLVVEELVRNDVRYFCPSPGMRSAPLIAAVASLKKANPASMTVVMHYDERGAAFHALGYARATGRPAAVISTSGTAAANYFPAVVEASADSVPLVVITADRPPELHRSGANQTIDQVKLYGDYVRWQFDLPCPDTQIDPRMVLTTVDQAVYRARRAPAGPVHLNCMFREPLLPASEDSRPAGQPALSGWLDSRNAYTSHVFPRAAIDGSDLAIVGEWVPSAKTGLLLVGHLENIRQRQAALYLSRQLGWPTLPDIRSGLRLVDEDHIIPYHDLALLSEKFANSRRPEMVLHLGGRYVSRRLLEFFEKSHPDHYVHISESPERLDPSHSVTMKIECDLVDACQNLGQLVSKEKIPSGLPDWQKASRFVGDVVAGACAETPGITEISIGRFLAENLPADNALFVASSMPIRNMAMFAGVGKGVIEIGANRGVSGIDGTIASAAGYAAGLSRSVTLLIGDLGCLHDFNSLALLNRIAQPVTVVILNNDGGGIFEFLPVARFKELCEQYFVTPHGLSFQNAAAMCNLPYTAVGINKADGTDAFAQAYSEATARGRSSIIEVATDRGTNLDLYHRIQKKIVSSLDSL